MRPHAFLPCHYCTVQIRIPLRTTLGGTYLINVTSATFALYDDDTNENLTAVTVFSYADSNTVINVAYTPDATRSLKPGTQVSLLLC